MAARKTAGGPNARHALMLVDAGGMRATAVEKSPEFASGNKPTERVKAWRESNRDRRLKKLREIHLRNKFQLTPDEYDRILESQGGVCALCECEPTSGISLHVDHDHGTGEIRGLLCMRCNNALGLFREDADLLKCAARYLTVDAKHRSQRTSWERLARRRVEALRGSAA